MRCAQALSGLLQPQRAGIPRAQAIEGLEAGTRNLSAALPSCARMLGSGTRDWRRCMSALQEIGLVFRRTLLTRLTIPEDEDTPSVLTRRGCLRCR